MPETGNAQPLQATAPLLSTMIKFSGVLEGDEIHLSRQLKTRLLGDKLRKLDTELKRDVEPGSTGWDVVDMLYVLETENRREHQAKLDKYELDLASYHHDASLYKTHMNWGERRKYRKKHYGKPPTEPSKPHYYSHYITLDNIQKRGGFINTAGLNKIFEVLEQAGYADVYRGRTPNMSSLRIKEECFSELTRMIQRRIHVNPDQTPLPEADNYDLSAPAEDKPSKNSML